MRSGKLLFCIALAVLFSCNRNDDPKPDESGLFVKFFGGASADNGFAAANYNDGYVLTGSTVQVGRTDKDLLIISADKNGNRVWEKKFGGEFQDEGLDVLVSGNKIVVLGYHQEKEDTSDLILIELESSTGKITRQISLGTQEDDEMGYSLLRSGDGSYVVLGSTSANDGSNTRDMFLARVNSDFSEAEWERNIGIIGVDDLVGKVSESGDHLLWCGTIYRAAGSDLRMIKSDRYGNLLWDYGFYENDGDDQFGYGMDIIEDKQEVLTAGSIGNGPDKDIFLVRTDLNGQLSSTLGAKRIVKEGEQEARSVIVTADNNYLVTGYTYDGNNRQVYIGSYSENGSLNWEKELGGSGDDIGNYLLQTSNDEYAIVGTATVSNNTMIVIYKVNEKGELVK